MKRYLLQKGIRKPQVISEHETLQEAEHAYNAVVDLAGNRRSHFEVYDTHTGKTPVYTASGR